MKPGAVPERPGVYRLDPGVGSLSQVHRALMARFVAGQCFDQGDPPGRIKTLLGLLIPQPLQLWSHLILGDRPKAFREIERCIPGDMLECRERDGREARLGAPFDYSLKKSPSEPFSSMQREDVEFAKVHPTVEALRHGESHDAFFKLIADHPDVPLGCGAFQVTSREDCIAEAVREIEF